MDTSLNNLILMGKYGLSKGVACWILAGSVTRYLILGENNLITRAQTRSFNKKLNSTFFIKTDENCVRTDSNSSNPNVRVISVIPINQYG